MAKIKELLATREKLKKYDELKEWKKKFEVENDKAGYLYGWTEVEHGFIFPRLTTPLPDYIRNIVITAIDAEMKKLEEEE